MNRTKNKLNEFEKELSKTYNEFPECLPSPGWKERVMNDIRSLHAQSPQESEVFLVHRIVGRMAIVSSAAAVVILTIAIQIGAFDYVDINSFLQNDYVMLIQDQFLSL